MIEAKFWRINPTRRLNLTSKSVIIFWRSKIDFDMFVSFEVELILLLGFILEEIAAFDFYIWIQPWIICSTHIYINISKQKPLYI